MNSKEIRIVYMGTPDFAVAPLKALVEARYKVVAVVTMPDKAIGRGLKIQPSPVKQYALSVGLPVLQPEKLKDEAFLTQLRSYHADLQIVVAFRMLPEVVWNMPPMGSINLHASLLPQYRGAAPIHWAVMNGDSQTGVSTFLLKHEIDTGNIILQERIAIADDEDTGSVHDRLMAVGAALVPQTVDLMAGGDYPTLPQTELAAGEILRPAPKLFKDNTCIDWTRSARSIYNMVRGLHPFPSAWCALCIDGQETTMKVHRVRAEECAQHEACGSVLTDAKKYLKVAVADGYVYLENIQLAGKKAMSAEDWLRGFHHCPEITLRK